MCVLLLDGWLPDEVGLAFGVSADEVREAVGKNAVDRFLQASAHLYVGES